MDELKEKLEKELLQLERKMMGASQSVYARYINDAYYLADLYKYYFGEDPHILTKDYRSKTANILDLIYNNRKEFFDLDQKLIDTYKEAGFYYFGRDAYDKISDDEFIELLGEFLNYFNVDIARIYNDIQTKRQFLDYDEKDIYGVSYLLPSLNNYYIGVGATTIRSDMMILETVIHELAHVYTAQFLKNYNYKGMENLLGGLFSETISLYSELSFTNFLANKWKYQTSVLYHRNTVDAELLSEYKCARYMTKALLEQSHNPNISVCSNGFNTWVEGEFEYDPDKDIPFFRSTDSIKKGTTSSILYSVGIVDAYKLLDLELHVAEPKEIINDYLISLQNENANEEFIQQVFDLSFMKKDIAERNEKLLKLQPITGYKIPF